MQYFSTLPKIIYTDPSGVSSLYTNLMARASIIPSLLQNPLVFYKYDIQEGDTPEIIAYKYYGDSYRYWIVLFANQILDPQWDWPLNYNQFNSYINDKYGYNESLGTWSVLNPYSTTYQWQKIITQYDASSQTTTVNTIVIDEDTYDNLVDTTNTYTVATGQVTISVTKKIDLRKLMVDMSYYEDIYTFSVSGYITIIDAQGFIELLQLTGNEFIEVDFGKIKNASNEDIQTFRVYKLGDRKPSGNNNSEPYTLYFCSEELLLSEQIKISKSYAGQKISYMVKDILTEKLKVKTSNIENIEETTGMYDFVIPKMKPFEAISWISTYARPQKYKSVSDMLFFETKNGYNFRSLQSMYKDDIYATYRYEPKNISYENQSIQDKTTQVLEYEFNKVFDMMNEISSGSFSNRLISIDPMTRSFNVTDFDYSKIQNELQKLNSSGPLNDMKNRLGISNSQNFEGVLKVVTGNSNEGNLPYIKEKEAGFAKDIAIETYVPTRTAAISLANYTSIKLSIPGDPGITAGRTINFDLYSLKPTTNLKELDKFYSGKYLVTAVRHIIQPTKYQTILEIAKDSSPNSYTQTNNNDPVMKAAVNT